MAAQAQTRVLFLCTGNSCRSQMAEGFSRHLKSGEIEAHSAGVKACSMSGSALSRLNLRGLWGALVLGLAYGILSGSCTFGFIAPILALITIQQKVLTGILFIVLFGIGHCVPIAIAGSSAALVKRVLENGPFQQASVWFQRLAGTVIGVFGIYLILRPFLLA